MNVEQVDITEDVRFAVFSDWHYQEDPDAAATSLSYIPDDSAAAKATADVLIDDMNQNFQPDLVILGGDTVHGYQGYNSGDSPPMSKSTWQTHAQNAVDYLTDNGGSSGNGLDAPIVPSFGDHEYMWTDEWGETYMYDAYDGISSLSDSYYVYEEQGLEIVVLNSGYIPQGNSQTSTIAPQQEIDWLAETLEASDKPKIVHSHYCPTWSAEYGDNLFGNMEGIQEALNNDPSIVNGIYGNNYNIDPPNVAGPQPQSWYQLHDWNNEGQRLNWLHVSPPNTFHGGDEVPYAKARVNVNGPRFTSGVIEASYADKGYSSYPTRWSFGPNSQSTEVAMGTQGVYFGGVTHPTSFTGLAPRHRKEDNPLELNVQGNLFNELHIGHNSNEQIKITSSELQFYKRAMWMFQGGGRLGLRFHDSNQVTFQFGSSSNAEMALDPRSVSFGKFINLSPQSSPPSNLSTDDIYLDDGSNTSDSNEGFRRYDGSAWVDIRYGISFNALGWR